MARVPEHTPQRGFETSAGVTARQLRKAESRFRVTAKTLRLAAFVLLIIIPGLLFYYPPMPGELVWALSVLTLLVLIATPVVGRLQLKKYHLPLRLPLEAKQKDPGDPLPGGTLRMARGSIYLGTCRETGEEVWLAQEDMLRHMLLLGTTGSGKTATLLGIAANMMAAGGGVIFSDAKGSTELYFRMHGLARRMGRDDDVLVMNFQTSQEELPGEKRSNSLNLFQGRSADTLLQIFLSLLPGQQGEGSNSVFAARAEGLMAAVLPPLAWLRDNEQWTLSLSLLSDCLTMDGVFGLSCIRKIPETEIAGLHAYVESLAGMNGQLKPGGQPTPRRPEDVPIPPATWLQALRVAEELALRSRDLARAGREFKRRSGWMVPEQPANQHGYASMYFTRPVQSLAVTYADLYDSPWGEIRLEDVISNRRILTIVLPVMEKSPAELRGLAKLVLSSIRSAVALGLGVRAEGTRAEAIDNLPTRSETVALVICDEYAYQLTEGFAAVAAQARSLHVGVIFAGQDLAGIRRAGKEEAGQVIANTLSKVVMRLAEPDDTADLAVKLGGKMYARMKTGAGTPEYREVDRINPLDLAAQIEGEAHILFGNQVVRANMFYPGDTTSDLMMMRRFINVPSTSDLVAIRDRVRQAREEKENKKRSEELMREVSSPSEVKQQQPGMPAHIRETIMRQATQRGRSPDRARQYQPPDAQRRALSSLRDKNKSGSRRRDST